MHLRYFIDDYSTVPKPGELPTPYTTVFKTSEECFQHKSGSKMYSALQKWAELIYPYVAEKLIPQCICDDFKLNGGGA